MLLSLHQNYLSFFFFTLFLLVSQLYPLSFVFYLKAFKPV